MVSNGIGSCETLNASASELTLAHLNVIEINNMTSNMTSLEAAMTPELN